MTEETKRKRGQRGPGKKPAMEHVTIRVPVKTMEFYRSFPSFSAEMREVLIAYAAAHKHA